jgi:plastocyanin
MATAATLAVDVRNAHGSPIHDAVVYALPEGRDPAPVKRTATMDQKNRTFVPHVLAVQTGTAVQFPNSDDIRHQVYSFSSAKTFQLPLYTGTPSAPIVFNQPGVVTLGCNIHDRMSAYIVVVDTPYFATTNGKGPVTLSNLTAGKYVVHVWHPDQRVETSALPISLAAGEQRELKFIVQ